MFIPRNRLETFPENRFSSLSLATLVQVAIVSRVTVLQVAMMSQVTVFQVATRHG